MKHITGNLITLAKSGHFDVIVHGANCFHTMGAGIALQIKEHFPEAYAADCKTAKGDPKKLQRFSYAQVGELIVVNAYTQFEPGPTAQLYHVREAMNVIGDLFGRDKRIGIPTIGCGIGGLKLENVIRNIDEVLPECTMVHFG